jgi:plasmid stabilization system protein ParE
MVLKWSIGAKRDLREIHGFYSENASLKVAKKMVERIIIRADQLIDAPYSGAVEKHLENKKFPYRFLVFRHFKIYYLVNGELVVIVGVFDCRQNPEKLKKLV